MSRKMIFMLLSLVWVLPRKWKEILNILFWKHDHEHVAEWFLNSKKSKRIWKSWDLSRSYDIIWGGYGKNWTGFKQIYHVWYLQIKVSQKKNRSVEKDSVRFGVKVTIKLRFDFKTFCIGNREQRLIHL